MKIDKYILTDIENAVAKGNKTNEQIAKAIGIPLRSFKRAYLEETKTHKAARSGTLIKEAISKGASKSRSELLKHAENGILRKIKQRDIKETKTELWYDGDGNIVKKHILKTDKTLEPDTTLLIFTAVNNSEHWQSINNPEIKQSTDSQDKIDRAKELLKTVYQNDIQTTKKV